MVKLAGGKRRCVGVLKLLWVTAHNRQVMLAGSSQEQQRSPMEELQGVFKSPPWCRRPCRKKLARRVVMPGSGTIGNQNEREGGKPVLGVSTINEL